MDRGGGSVQRQANQRVSALRSQDWVVCSSPCDRELHVLVAVCVAASALALIPSCAAGYHIGGVARAVTAFHGLVVAVLPSRLLSMAQAFEESFLRSLQMHACPPQLHRLSTRMHHRVHRLSADRVVQLCCATRALGAASWPPYATVESSCSVAVHSAAQSQWNSHGRSLSSSAVCNCGTRTV